MIFDELKPGSTLGRYEILMPVARGDMATVWAARLVGTRGFQKLVAIKTILPALSDDPDFEAMLLDEARLAARIRHPHVVEIVDLGEENEWLYLVMEWVNGETLATISKRAKAKGGIALPLLLRILSSACAGLQAAHDLKNDAGELVGLVHRDISPQNIMVSYEGIVKIVDFGVAKASDRAHQTGIGGIMKGKVPYLSPEQLDGKSIDRRSDLFSLGVIAYSLVSGRHPFRGETDKATMHNIESRAPVPLNELVPDVDPRLAAIIGRALEKNPDDRFPDAAAMQRELEATLRELGASVTDGDVAAYVRELLSDLMDDRNKALARAIEGADVRANSSPPSPRRPKPVVASGPLPATFEGILPVALDAAGEPSPELRLTAVAPLTVTSRGRQSPLPRLLIVLAVLAAGAAAAAYALGYV